MVQPATTQNAQGMQEQGADRGVLAPRTFLSEQSVGSVIRNTMALYRSNFRPLFLA